MRFRTCTLALGLSLGASTMALAQQSSSPSAAPAQPGQMRTVEMHDSKGGLVGTVQVRSTAHGALFTVNLMNMPPGTHGFHVHERGVCDPPDFKTAGGHFNPAHGEHGFDTMGKQHAGDLPNLHVDGQGKVIAEFHSDMLTLGSAPAMAQTSAGTTGQQAGSTQDQAPFSLLGPNGTAIVVHANADDYRDLASAGGRIACGVIKAP